MVRVGIGQRQGVAENAGSLLKCDSVLPAIKSGFGRIPFECHLSTLSLGARRGNFWFLWRSVTLFLARVSGGSAFLMAGFMRVQVAVGFGKQNFQPAAIAAIGRNTDAR